MGPEEHLKKHAGTDRKRSADTRRRERRRAGFNHRTGRARRFLEEEGRAASDISSRSANSAERAEERATRDESGPPCTQVEHRLELLQMFSATPRPPLANKHGGV